MDSEGLPLQSEDHNNSRKISRAVYSAAFVVGLAICPNAMDQSITAQRQISGKLRLCDNPSLAQTMTLPVEALEIEVLPGDSSLRDDHQEVVRRVPVGT